MIRSEKNVEDKKIIETFLQNNKIIRIAFNTGDAPYIVPLTYGFTYDGGLVFYSHGAPKGRKVDLALSNPFVGFEIDNVSAENSAELACKYSLDYESIIGTGMLQILESADEKKNGLDKIMYQITGKEQWAYDEKMLENTAVFKLVVDEFSMKNSD